MYLAHSGGVRHNKIDKNSSISNPIVFILTIIMGTETIKDKTFYLSEILILSMS